MIAGRELVQAVLGGRDAPRFPVGPLAVHFTATPAGVDARRYTTSADALAECVITYYERFRPDAVWISSDTWVTAEAMGAEVGFIGHDQPMCCVGGPIVRSARDLGAIPRPDPHSLGRMPLMLQALRTVRERIGGEAFIVGCFDQSPFSLACGLAGRSEVLDAVAADRPFIDALLERCIEHAAEYALAMAEAGADMLSTGDSPAGLVGPEIYQRVALPAERRLFGAIRARCDLPLSLHICGRAAHILAHMAESGADVLEIDAGVDLGRACEVVPSRIALWGNLDPIRVLQNGTPEDVRLAAEQAIRTVRHAGRRRFVLSSGCTLSQSTPPENVRALIEVGKRPVASIDEMPEEAG